jgi:hypothetical protein
MTSRRKSGGNASSPFMRAVTVDGDWGRIFQMSGFGCRKKGLVLHREVEGGLIDSIRHGVPGGTA